LSYFTRDNLSRTINIYLPTRIILYLETISATRREIILRREFAQRAVERERESRSPIDGRRATFLAARGAPARGQLPLLFRAAAADASADAFGAPIGRIEGFVPHT